MCYDYVYHFLNKLNYTILMLNEFIFILFLSFLYIYIYINFYLLVDLYNVVYKNKFYFVLLLDFFFHLLYHHGLVKGKWSRVFWRGYMCVHIQIWYWCLGLWSPYRKWERHINFIIVLWFITIKLSLYTLSYLPHRSEPFPNCYHGYD